jgi:glucose/arabinose dehydrogenase
MNRRLAALAACLLATAAVAQTPAPTNPPIPVVPTNPDYSALQEGKPVDSRQNENKDDHPLYPEQTRAPYHKTAPYKLTEITGGLQAPWALAFLPDGKFLVTERLPGALRVVDAGGTISAPVAGVTGLATG